MSKRSIDNGRSWGPLQVVGENVDGQGIEHVAQSPTGLVDLTDPDNPEGKLFLYDSAPEQ